MQDQAVIDSDEQPPQAKRRVSRLQHMAVNRCSKAQQQHDLPARLSPATKAHGKRPLDADDQRMLDVQDRSSGSPARPTAPSPHSRSGSQGAAAPAQPQLPGLAVAAAPSHMQAKPAEVQQLKEQLSPTTVAQGSTSTAAAQGPADSNQAAQACTVMEPPAFLSPQLPPADAVDQSAAQEPAEVTQPTETALPQAVLEQGFQSETARQDTPAPVPLEGTLAAAEAYDARQPAPQHHAGPAADGAASAGASADDGAEAAAAHAADTAAASAVEAAAAGQQGPEPGSGRLPAMVLDEDDDDEWEDQPAPLLQEGDDEPEAADGDAGADADADAGAGDSWAERTGPQSRRRNLYDDEDEWEELVLQEKHTQPPGSQAHSGVCGSQAGSESGGGGNILLGDDDAANAQTQRLLRESAVRSGFSKGFKPQVAPLSSLLGKLQARAAALGAKAGQAPLAAAAAAAAAEGCNGEQQKPALTLDEVRAHLERHSVLHRQQQPAGMSAGAQQPAAAAASAPGDAMDVDAGGGDIAFDDIDDIDDLIVEGALQQQQQQQQPHSRPAAGADGAVQLPPETQAADELDDLQRTAAAAGVAVGTELPADLQLQLGDDDACDDRPELAARPHEPQQQQQQGDQGQPQGAAAGTSVSVEAEEAAGGEAAAGSGVMQEDSQQQAGMQGSGSDGQGDGSEEEEEEEEGEEEEDGSEGDDPLADLSLSEEEEEGPSQEAEAAPEPLNWEEEEEELAGPGSSSQQQQQQVVKAFSKAKASKLVAKLRHKAAAYGFIEVEAELSDDEAGSDDEEDDEDDGMLEELLADATEGRLDESQRAALHARWADAQEAKQVRELLAAIKNGFRRKRRLGAGLEGDDDEDGTDAEARRRRARLLGLADGEGGDDDGDAVITGTDRLQRLDFSWRPEDELDEDAAAAAVAVEQAARHKRQQLHKLTKQAQESQQDGDIMHLLQMDVDADSQHTVELLSKSASMPAHTTLVPADAAPGRDSARAGGSSRGPSGLRQASGPHSTAGPSAAAAGAGAGAGVKAGVKAGGGGAGFMFKMFGKDVAAGGGTAALKASSSFIGRQASSSVGVRSASNYGASRTFVFGSDLAAYSNPGGGGGSNHAAPQQQQQQHRQPDDSKAAAGAGGGAGLGPSSFAGLGKMIADAKAGQGGRHGLGGAGSAGRGAAGGASGQSMLLDVLHSKSGFEGTAPALNVITAAVGTKLAGAQRRQGGAAAFQFD